MTRVWTRADKRMFAFRSHALCTSVTTTVRAGDKPDTRAVELNNKTQHPLERREEEEQMGGTRQKTKAKCATEDDDADSDARDIEYVKAMLEYVKDDARQDYVRVTAALALAAIFVTQVPISELRSLNQVQTVVLFAGLSCLVLAATAYFTYVQETHLARRRMSDYLLTLDTRKLRCDANKLFRSRRRLIRFHVGNTLLLVGVVLLGYVLWVLVTSSH